MLNVFITVDTEFWDRRDGTIGTYDENIDTYIYGKTSAGNFGIPYTIEVLNRYGLKAVFFVESLSVDQAGVGRVEPFVDLIRREGHDVQLHVHPEWVSREAHVSVNRGKIQYMHQLSADDQTALIQKGIDNLKKCGVEKVCAFRSGNYGSNPDTLRAVGECGLLYDSSYNPCYLDTACRFDGTEKLLQPMVFGRVAEFPVSVFTDFTGKDRHAQVCACSYEEMRNALFAAWRERWFSFVIVSHSFELLNISRSGKGNTPNSINCGRFEKLCRFLAENTEKFRVATFCGISPDEIPADYGATPISVPAKGTLLRYAEQLRQRLA